MCDLSERTVRVTAAAQWAGHGAPPGLRADRDDGGESLYKYTAEESHIEGSSQDGSKKLKLNILKMAFPHHYITGGNLKNNISCY